VHPLRRQRLQIVILIIFAGACASALIIYALGQNANFFILQLRLRRARRLKGPLFAPVAWSWREV
jgi:cytochrome c-type biogenesis protein CcmE